MHNACTHNAMLSIFA